MTQTYSVPTISCDHCKKTIEAAVSAQAGVSDVVVDVATKTVRVDGTASEAAVRAAIEAAGYEVARSSAP